MHNLNANQAPKTFHYKEITEAASIIRAVNHKLRFRILNLLAQNGPLNVTELRIWLKEDQSIVSQQLAILRRAQVVTNKKSGQEVYYTLNTPVMANLENFVYSLVA
jgi:DNA-binding transcriptional ArsR family regulator